LLFSECMIDNKNVSSLRKLLFDKSGPKKDLIYIHVYTRWTTTSCLESLNTKKTMKQAWENPGPGLSVAQICGGVELVNNGIPLPLEN
jgi:hypothetical protein